jgi:amino-acid N-acetyltransferase
MDLDKILAVTLSGVRPEDENAVLALVAGCGLHAGDLSSEKLRHFLVARKGDAAIGAVGLEVFSPHALLRSLAVAEDFRGLGIARRLIGAIERHARNVGVNSIYLLTLTAAGLFDKCGYRQANRASAPEDLQATEEFRTVCPDSATCLHKAI